MGAYTLVLGSEFNGFSMPRIRYLLDVRHSHLLSALEAPTAEETVGRGERTHTVTAESD